MTLEYNPLEPVTYELAKRAAEQIREYRHKNVCLKGADWVWPTFNLNIILQEWRRTKDPRANEFEEEYDYIRGISSFNWHMFEEPDR